MFDRAVSKPLGITLIIVGVIVLVIGWPLYNILLRANAREFYSQWDQTDGIASSATFSESEQTILRAVYSYSVDGITYQNNRIFVDRGFIWQDGASPRFATERRIRSGTGTAPVTVYYRRNDPADSTLALGKPAPSEQAAIVGVVLIVAGIYFRTAHLIKK